MQICSPSKDINQKDLSRVKLMYNIIKETYGTYNLEIGYTGCPTKHDRSQTN